MKRFLVGFLLLVGATACGGGDKKDDKNDCGAADACSSPAQCPLGFTCGASGCCEEFGCTPGSCGSGQFCDDDFQCKSVADKCAFETCECHILNGAGEIEAAGTPRLAVGAGGALELRAVLAVQKGQPLPGAEFTFAAATAPAGNDTAFAGLFTLAGKTVTAKTGVAAGSAVVKASVAGVSCTADVYNLGAAVGSDVRAYVFDDVTGVPVAGASVLFDFGNDGTIDGTVTTDAAGLGSVGIGASGTYTVSVFKSGYNYLSVVGVTTSVADLALPLAARPSPPETGGFTGKFDYTTYERNVLGASKTYRFGLVASSFPLKSILNFDVDLLLGSSLDVDCEAIPRPAGCYVIDIPPLVDNQVAALPGGLVFSLKNREVKPFFDSTGLPGRRYAWSLGGQLELSDIQPLINIITPMLNPPECACDVTGGACDASCTCDTDCGGNQVNFGDVFNALVPLFANFASGVQGNLPMKKVGQSAWDNYIAAPYSDRVDSAGNFPRLDDGTGGYGKLVLREPLRRFSDITMPGLPNDPKQSGVAMEGVLLITGVNTTGFGYVPLGIAAGLDCTQGDCLDRVGNAANFDGKVNGGTMCFDVDSCPTGVPETIGTGHVGLFRAAAHSGLEGQEWVTVSIAAPLSQLTGDDGMRVTAFVARGEPTVGALNWSSKTYPSFPTMPATVTGRSYTVAGSPDADVHWVTVATADDSNGVSTRWNIYFANPSTTATFVAPTLPGGFTSDPFVTGAGAELDATHIGFQLPASVTLDTLVANRGRTLADLVGEVEGFTAQNRSIPVQ